jgi:hypothetical protein
MIVEIVLSRPVAGVSATDMRDAALAAGPVLDQLPGLRTREVLFDGKEQWADIVRWDTMADAEQAMPRVGQHPLVQALFMKIDEPSSEMFFLNPVQSDPLPHVPQAESAVTELALFRTTPTVTADEMREVVAQTWGRVAAQPGYLRRDLLANGDGQWVDVVRWRTLDDAMRAMSTMEQDPAMLPFVQRIDPHSVRMFHLHGVAIHA